MVTKNVTIDQEWVGRLLALATLLIGAEGMDAVAFLLATTFEYTLLTVSDQVGADMEMLRESLIDQAQETARDFRKTVLEVLEGERKGRSS